MIAKHFLCFVKYSIPQSTQNFSMSIICLLQKNPILTELLKT